MSRRVFFRDSEAQGFSTYGLLLDTLFRQLKTVGISQYFPYEYREDMSCDYAELVSFFGEVFGRLAEQEGDASNLSILSKHVSLRGILLERYRKDNEKYLAAVNSLSIGSLKRVVEVDEPSWDKLYASAEEEEDTEEEYQEGIKASSEGKSTSAAMNSFLAAINGIHAVDDSVAPAYVEEDVDEPVGGSFSNEDYSWEEDGGILPDDDEEEGEDEWEGSDTLPEDDEDAWEGSDTLPEDDEDNWGGPDTFPDDEDEEEENEGVLPDDEDEGGVVALPVELPADEDSGVLPDDDDEEDYSSELPEDDDEEDYSSELPEDDDEEDYSTELPEGDEGDLGVLPDDEDYSSEIPADDDDYSTELPEDDDEEDYSPELPADDEDYTVELPEDDDQDDPGVLPDDEEDYSTELPDDEDNVDTVKPKAYTVPTSVVSYSTNISPAPAMVVHPSYARGIPGRETQEAVLDMMNKLANNIKGWFSRL